MVGESFVWWGVGFGLDWDVFDLLGVGVDC